MTPREQIHAFLLRNRVHQIHRIARRKGDTFAMIIVLPWLNVANGSLTAFHPLTTATPAISLLSLNLLGKMGFGAFGGLSTSPSTPVNAVTR